MILRVLIAVNVILTLTVLILWVPYGEYAVFGMVMVAEVWATHQHRPEQIEKGRATRLALEKGIRYRDALIIVRLRDHQEERKAE